MDNNIEIKSENTKTKKKWHRVIIIVPIAVIAVLITAILLFCMLPHNTEVGEDIRLRTEAAPFSHICGTVTDLDSISTDSLGSHSIKLRLFGFLDLPATLTVKDTVPPALILRELSIPKGASPLAEDFVAEALDKTSLTYKIESIAETSSGGTAVITAVDEGGNVTTKDTRFTVYDGKSMIVLEKGTDDKEIAALVKKHTGISTADILFDRTSLGEVHAIASANGADYLVILDVTDTLAPDYTAVSHDILLGQTLSREDFVTDIRDASEYTVSYVTDPDFDKPGHQTVKLLLKDEHGNETTAVSHLNIHKLESPLVIEAGTSARSLGYIISNLLGTDDPLPRVTESFEPEHLPLGTHKAELIGEYSVIPIDIVIEDTTPPKVTLRRLTVYAGNAPKVTDFLVECSDESGVHFKFKEEPDVTRTGNFIITVIATDSAGNSAEFNTSLKVTRDDVPPTFYGISDIEAYEGDTVSYRSGVYAIDDRDGKVNVKVDASNVNTNVPGTYFVTYSAQDSDGNTAKATASVKINPITIGAAYALADEILAQIIKDGMTDTEKARAIYDWSTANIRYSTLTSNLMGYYAKASYSGFSKRYGNCYTYYAVTSVLLTRAGITNIQIQRNSVSDPHYWNLVNIGDAWYHLDTCPQPPPHKLEVFLLTDSQVRAFSKNKVANYYNFNADNYPATP